MKSLLRESAMNTVALLVLPFLIQGVTIQGGALTYILGGVALTLMLLILKPILQIISFPLNVVTLGLFSLFTNAIILYLLTVFVPNIMISSYTFPGATIAGIIIPQVYVHAFFALFLSAAVISTITGIIRWIIE